MTYQPGRAFWRVPVEYFSSWNFNSCATAPPRKLDGTSDGIPSANGQMDNRRIVPGRNLGKSHRRMRPAQFAYSFGPTSL